eukprot:a680566_203.p1 GENE.a680566_203~~a680566_203.p1  ORF type:complete len:120 (-),score=37.49 a680566_203:164-490(-)
MGTCASSEPEPAPQQKRTTQAAAPAAPAAPKPVKEIPPNPPHPGFEKPDFSNGGTEAEYKLYMQRRLEYENFENRTLKRNMIIQKHRERGCACNGGQGACSNPLPMDS